MYSHNADDVITIDHCTEYAEHSPVMSIRISIEQLTDNSIQIIYYVPCQREDVHTMNDYYSSFNVTCLHMCMCTCVHSNVLLENCLQMFYVILCNLLETSEAYTAAMYIHECL